MLQASAAAFRTPFALVGWFVLSLYVAAKFLGSSAAAFEYVTPMVKALLSSSSSRAAAFKCVTCVYTDYLGVWLSTTLSQRRGPRKALQAKATPRVDVAEVPQCSLFPAGSVCEVVLRSVSGKFWGRHTWFSGHSSVWALLPTGDPVRQDFDYE